MSPHHFVEKNKNMRKIFFFLKGEWKTKPKRRVKKKNEKPFFKTQKKQNMENELKKRCPTKKRIRQNRVFGNRRKQKKGVLQKFIRIPKIVKKVMDTENKETIKEQEKTIF